MKVEYCIHNIEPKPFDVCILRNLYVSMLGTYARTRTCDPLYFLRMPYVHLLIAFVEVFTANILAFLDMTAIMTS